MRTMLFGFSHAIIANMKHNIKAILLIVGILTIGCGGKGGSQNTGTQTGGVLVRQDPEGLVSVSIVNGQGELTLDIDKYDSLYKAYDNKNDFSKGPFKIVTHQDSAIEDAYVGRVRDLSFYEGTTPLLYVVLLLENGTIERSEVYPYLTAGDEFYTFGPLPWLTDIASISSENNTVYAINESGRKHDVYIPVALPNIGRNTWVMTLNAGSEQNNIDHIDHIGSIRFTSENSVTYEIWNDEGNWMEYSGYYEMVLHEGHSSGWPANTLQLFLFLESFDGVLDTIMQNMPQDIEAALSVTVDPHFYNLELKQISGTNLFGHGGFFQEKYTLEQMYGGDPIIYPYEMIEYLTGNWAFVLEGPITCNFDVYNSIFGPYSLNFKLTFSDTEGGFEFFGLDGGLSSYTEYSYGVEVNNLTLHFSGKGMMSETYSIKDLGVHRGVRMMRLFPEYNQNQSAFDQLELQARYGSADVPLVFAKFTLEQRTGRQRVNATFNAIYWEYDSSKNTVWLTEAGLAGDESACASVEYKVSGVEDWQILEAFPGMDCQVRTNAQGEVVEFVVTMG